MKKSLILTLEIEVSDLPKSKRDVIAWYSSDDPDNLPTLEDVEPSEIGDVLEGLEMRHISEELFAGTNIYVYITKVRTIASSNWIEHEEN